ncbi:MAG: putative zinc-finger, partial [Actinomycetota bacterium]
MDIQRDCGCASAFGRIEALVDGQLDAAECAEIRNHCETCESCAGELDVVTSLSQKFRAALSEPCPTEVRDSLFRTLNITA